MDHSGDTKTIWDPSNAIEVEVARATFDALKKKRPRGNVDVVGRDGKPTHRLCAHPNAGVPDFDTMLAQKLMLEHDDSAFFNVANKHPLLRADMPLLPALH
jgi:hypothetical protein